MIEDAVMVGSGMRVSCGRDDLVQRVGIVSRAVSTRTAVQILSGILLRAEAGELQLAATDMELSLRTSLAAEVDGAGSVVVPGRLLLEIARALPEADVELEHRADEGVLRLTCGQATFKLHTYNADDFPRLPDLDLAQSFAVDSDTLLETVGRVSRSASRDESRPVLTGILV